MSFEIKRTRATNFLWGCLLFLIIAFPRILQIEKIVLCLLITFFSILIERQCLISHKMICFLRFWIPYVFITSAVGILYGNVGQGIYDFIKVNAINLGLYVIIISCISRSEHYETTMKVLTISLGYIAAYNLLLILGSYSGLNLSWLQSWDATAGVGVHEGYSHIVSTNLSMTMFLFPLILFNLRVNSFKKIVSDKFAKIVLITTAIAMILSGRRMIWIVLAVSLFVFFLKESKNPLKMIEYMIAVAVIAVVGISFLESRGIISIKGLIERFQFAFAALDEYGQVNARTSQSSQLIEGFMNHFFFGNGAGATIPGFYRNDNSPWMFELSYHLVLFQSGIVGAVFYFSSLLSIAKTIWKRGCISKEYRFAVFVAYLCGLFSNATNPYFSSSFDFMIWLFIPILLMEQDGMNFEHGKMED